MITGTVTALKFFNDDDDSFLQKTTSSKEVFEIRLEIYGIKKETTQTGLNEDFLLNEGQRYGGILKRKRQISSQSLQMTRALKRNSNDNLMEQQENKRKAESPEETYYEDGEEEEEKEVEGEEKSESENLDSDDEFDYEDTEEDEFDDNELSEHLDKIIELGERQPGIEK